MITNRGVKVYPHGNKETYCTDHWRCRFISKEANPKDSNLGYVAISHEDIVELLTKVHAAGLEVIKTENLYNFSGQRGFSLGQGE